jgi:hypothetical protein
MSTLMVQLPEGLKDQLTLAARRFGKLPARFVWGALENRPKATQYRRSKKTKSFVVFAAFC